MIRRLKLELIKINLQQLLYMNVESFCQKDLQRQIWQRELELFIQYFDWPKPDEDW